jgi:hypothetical protein
MRLDYRQALPEAPRAMSQLERVVEASILDPGFRQPVGAYVSHLHPVPA